MARTIAPVVAERLAAYLLDRPAVEPFRAELTGWFATAPRFRAFAELYRDKIRRKLRGAADAEAIRDVRVELHVARVLLADSRFEVAFEPYGTGKRGPDFAVTFRAGRAFNLEVTRLRRPPRSIDDGRAIVAKLRQLRAGSPNALLLAMPAAPRALDVSAATRALRARADARDDAFLGQAGYVGPRAFYEQYLRLAAVFVASEPGCPGDRPTAWTNRSARIALPTGAAAAILGCLEAG